MIILGDCLEEMKKLADNSVDAIVTDPPYGLSFMGKKWDYDVPSIDLWLECNRVLKPGGHVLSFGGTRTYHRMVVAIEDAGFEIRDQIQWLYGQGFPKATNCAKQAVKVGIACECKTSSEYDLRPMSEENLSETLHDENQSRQILQHGLQEPYSQISGAKGAESEASPREESVLEGRQIRGANKGLCDDPHAETSQGEGQRLRIGTHLSGREDAGPQAQAERSDSSFESQPGRQSPGKSKDLQKSQGTLDGSPLPRCPRCKRSIFPEGWFSALKPANEPICLARKPLSEKTLALNVQKWGTGAINVDGCRVDGVAGVPFGRQDGQNGNGKTMGKMLQTEFTPHAQGRWPANVIFDEEAAGMLDEQSGVVRSNGNKTNDKSGHQDAYVGGELLKRVSSSCYADSGGASRFFYCAKSSKAERNAGLDEFDCFKLSLDPCEENTEQVALLLAAIFDLVASNLNIAVSGESITGTCLKECTSTIRTTIQRITELKIWNSLMLSHTSESMKDVVLKLMDGISPANSAVNLKELTIPIGILVVRVGSATDDVKNATYKKLLSIKEESAWQKFSSSHPTVKPLKLMAYLCRLITPPKGIILDPFMGSGTTGIAAKQEGFEFIGIEMNEEYFEIAKRRIAAAEQQLKVC